MTKYEGVKSLKVYREAYELAMLIFNASKRFPKEEQYALTDQVRRSSRSVCANLAEGYRKRIFPKHFKSKLTDCDAELAETLTWIDFSYDCQYINLELHEELHQRANDIGAMLGEMILNPEKFKPFEKQSAVKR
jgi:four helix bundle protein